MVNNESYIIRDMVRELYIVEYIRKVVGRIHPSVFLLITCTPQEHLNLEGFVYSLLGDGFFPLHYPFTTPTLSGASRTWVGKWEEGVTEWTPVKGWIKVVWCSLFYLSFILVYNENDRCLTLSVDPFPPTWSVDYIPDPDDQLESESFPDIPEIGQRD